MSLKKSCLFLIIILPRLVLAQYTYIETNIGFSTSINFDVGEPLLKPPVSGRTSTSMVLGYESALKRNFFYYNIGIGYQQNRFTQNFSSKSSTLGGRGTYHFSTLEFKTHIGAGIKKLLTGKKTAIYIETGLSPSLLLKNRYTINNDKELLVSQKYPVYYSNSIELRNSKAISNLINPFLILGAENNISEKLQLMTYCKIVYGAEYIASTAFTIHPTQPNTNEIHEITLDNKKVQFNRMFFGLRIKYSL